MLFGAASTGYRVITASSDPGFSLKQEGISYIASPNLPAVIVDVCRYGSGLGLISPEQGDYFQATKGGGHGDYQLPVFAPHTIQESVDLIALAFDKAEEYLTPVILLTDGALGQRMGGDVALAVHGEKPVYLMPTGMTPSKEQKILEMV